MTLSLVNGIASDYVSVHDRGLLYGDGVFETIAYQNGKVQFLGEHLARMQMGAARLNIPFPDESLFIEDIDNLTNQSKKDNGVIKFMLTRGHGTRGYRPDHRVIPTRISQFFVWPEHINPWKSQGINTRICGSRASTNSTLAGIKHLNRLENIMASSELGADYHEGFLLDDDNHVIEGTMSNIFIVNGQTLVTPELTRCGISGIIRDQVLKIARDLQINTEVRSVSKEELHQADEIFITNSLLGVCSVNTIDDIQLQSRTTANTLDTALSKRINQDA